MDWSPKWNQTPYCNDDDEEYRCMEDGSIELGECDDDNVCDEDNEDENCNDPCSKGCELKETLTERCQERNVWIGCDESGQNVEIIRNHQDCHAPTWGGETGQVCYDIEGNDTASMRP
eukprot:UN07950